LSATIWATAVHTPTGKKARSARSGARGGFTERTLLFLAKPTLMNELISRHSLRNLVKLFCVLLLLIVLVNLSN
jgi:hypothetical protein